MMSARAMCSNNAIITDFFPVLVYPQKKPVPVHYHKGALLTQCIKTSENGWINGDLHRIAANFY